MEASGRVHARAGAGPRRKVERRWVGEAGGRGDGAQMTVVEVAIDMVVGEEAGVVVLLCGQSGMDVCSLRVLALPLVGVLMPAKGLRRRELAAAVVALELLGALSTVGVGDCVGGALLGVTGFSGRGRIVEGAIL